MVAECSLRIFCAYVIDELHIGRVGLCDVKWKIISEEDAWNGKEGYGGSFELEANDAIRYAINKLHFN